AQMNYKDEAPNGREGRSALRLLVASSLSQHLLINAQRSLHHFVGGEALFDATAAPFTEITRKGRVSQDFLNCMRDRIFIGRFHKQTTVAILDDLGGTARVESDRRHAVGHG